MKKPPAFRERVKKVKIRPYGGTLTIIVSSDIWESWRRRKRRLPSKGGPSEGAGAFVWRRDGDPDVFAFLPEKVGLGTTAHEMFHVVSHILFNTGVNFNEEAFAYHLGELTQITAEFVHINDKNKYRDPK